MRIARALPATACIVLVGGGFAPGAPAGSISRSVDPWRLPTGAGAAVFVGEVYPGTGLPEGEPCGVRAGSAMYRRVHGVSASIDSLVLRRLAACGLPRQPDVPLSARDASLVTLWRIFICPGAGEASREVTVSQAPNGVLWAHAPSGAGGATVAQALRSAETYGIIGDWPAYEGGFDAPPVSNPGTVDLSRPYVGASITLDKDGLSQRFLRGRAATIDGTSRLLRLERMRVRAPRGYTPRTPAGLLIWVSADDGGDPPACLHAACDAANIVIIGIDNCGNSRPIANRYQLILDAVATGRRRFHVDNRRVYISGLSGGGRVASIMTACFPEIFSGAVPIVGLSHFEKLNVPGRGTVVPAFAKPSERLMGLLRRRRIGAVTGARDFNQGEIQAAATAMRGDGLQVRTFEAVDLGHELPKPDLFTEALAWIDEPYQEARRGEIEQAERALKAALARLGDRVTLNDADRETLMRVTEAGPWTPAAWRAVELLDRAAVK
ncbi:MAG: hypothetical protein ACK4WH_06735 [Phycisphaerales bacterium]